MKARYSWMLLVVLATVGSGCVAQREYDELRTLYRQSQDQVIELKAQLEECNARIAALQAAANDPEMAGRLAALTAERDALQKALDEAERQLREAGMILPQPLSDALAELAAANPDLMSYDPDRGMVKLRSDLTFALGSADVQPAAVTALQRLATVLNSAAAAPYEVRIVGHTDNVRIANPATKAKHPTNWHLSAHRAIAVQEVIQGAGVSPVRIGVGGYGEYRPAVPNGPRGAEANRRVEIYLVPMSRSTASAASAAPTVAAPQAQPVAPAAPAEAPEMFK